MKKNVILLNIPNANIYWFVFYVCILLQDIGDKFDISKTKCYTSQTMFCLFEAALTWPSCDMRFIIWFLHWHVLKGLLKVFDCFYIGQICNKNEMCLFRPHLWNIDHNLSFLTSSGVATSAIFTIQQQKCVYKKHKSTNIGFVTFFVKVPFSHRDENSVIINSLFTC